MSQSCGAIAVHCASGTRPRKSNAHFASGVRPPFRFPEHLITLRKAWQQAHAELVQAPTEAAMTALRHRLIALPGTLCTHPHWTAPDASWCSSP